MSKRWEHQGYTATMDSETVSVGHHRGPPQAWAGGACSIAEFRAGRFQGLIADELGDQALEEMLALLDAPDEALKAHQRGVAALVEAWRAVPLIAGAIAEQDVRWAPRITRGYPEAGTRLQLPGGLVWTRGEHQVAAASVRDAPESIAPWLRAKLEALDYDTLELPDGQELLAPVHLLGDVLFAHGHLFVVAADDIHILDPRGALVFTSRAWSDSHGLGFRIRARGLGQHGGRIVAGYHLMMEEHTQLYALLSGGVLVLEVPGGIVGRLALKK